MNCPICHRSMKKVSWQLSTNQKQGSEHKEYDKTLYHCENDDAWVETELPVEK